MTNRRELRPATRPLPQPGDRVFVRCEGGPCISRLVDYPLPLEIADWGGLYVLDDDGTQDEWNYFWVPSDL